MKVQTIEALERNDFAYMSAPLYVKGFLKLYGAYLGLDPEQLIREYMEHHAPRARPSLLSDTAPARPAGEAGGWRKVCLRAWNQLGAWWREFRRSSPACRAEPSSPAEHEATDMAAGSPAPALRLAWIGAALLVLILCGRWACARRAPDTTPPPPPVLETPARPDLPLLVEPPDPYLGGAASRSVP